MKIGGGESASRQLVLVIVDGALSTADFCADQVSIAFDVKLEALVTRQETRLFTDTEIVAIHVGAAGAHADATSSACADWNTDTDTAATALAMVGVAILQTLQFEVTATVWDFLQHP